MLTTYNRCKNHEDEVRKDSNEGSCQYNFNHQNTTTAGWQDVGFQSYMFCTSMIESEQLMTKFNADGYFWIDNLFAFCDVVSRYIPGFEYGRVGACSYKKSRVISRTTDNPVRPCEKELNNAMSNEDQRLRSQALNNYQRTMSGNVNQELADESYFLKENTFSDEAEVRIIWTVPYDVKETITITCPEAIQFCSPGTLLSKDFEKNHRGEGDIRGAMISIYSEPQV